MAPGLVSVAERRVQVLLDARRFEEGAAAAEELLTLQSANPTGHWALATLTLTRQRPDLAVEHCARGLGALTTPELFTALAQARLMLGQSSAALEAAEQALRPVPDDVDGLLMRAAARLQLGDPTRALGDLDRAIELAGPRPEVLLGRARVHVARGDFEAAQRDCEQSLELDPSGTSPRRLLAAILGGKGEHAAAERELSRLLERYPDYVLARVERADARLALGDVAGTRRDLDRAVRDDPRMVQVWARRASLRLRQGDRSGAAADARRALELGPRDAATVTYLAAALHGLGEEARALELIDAVLRASGDPSERAGLQRLRAELTRPR